MSFGSDLVVKEKLMQVKLSSVAAAALCHLGNSEQPVVVSAADYLSKSLQVRLKPFGPAVGH
jgi:hypothetical protein